MDLEDSLDAVERTADDAQRLARNTAGAQLLARESRQLPERGGLPVHALGQRQARQRALQVGQEPRVGIAKLEIAGTRRDRHRRP
jgi:hypothetical protein